MATNTLNTRIQQKFDTLANWTTNSSVVQLKGEIAIVEIPEVEDQMGNISPPTYAIKVGDGTKTFAQLPYIQALAGDVYAWAKAATKPVYSATEITGLSDFVSGEIQDTDTQYKLEQDPGDGRKLLFYSKTKDGAWGSPVELTIPTSTLVPGTANGTVAFNGTDVAVKGLGSAAYTQTTAYATSAQGAKADSAVQTVSGDGVSQTGTSVSIDLSAYALLTQIGVKDVSYTAGTGVFVFTMADDTQKTFDLNIEKIVANFEYSAEDEALILTYDDGTTDEVPLSSFIQEYTAAASASQVQVAISNHEISATLVDGGVTEAKLASAVTGKLNQAHTHANKTVLDGIDAGDIANWDSKTDNVGTVTSVQVQAGGGLTGGGTVTSAGTINIAHAAKPSSGTPTKNTGRTYIQNIEMDTYGHIVNVTTGTETVTDTGVTSVTANNGLTGQISGRQLTIGVSSINANLLNQTAGDYLILSCGSSTVNV